MNPHSDYQHDLLTAWEDTYKKGQLTLWIFLALRDGPKYVNEIRAFIEEYSDHAITCEGQSLYRALRKFSHLDIVSFENGKGDRGPDRKYYQLTNLGETLLDEFVKRHIRIFLKPELSSLLGITQEAT